MPLARYVRPELHFIGAAPRKLGLALAFIVAGASGIAVFLADSGPDADPMTALALAPIEGPATPAQLQAAEVAFAQNPSETGGSKPLCGQTSRYHFIRDCTRGNPHEPRSVANVTEGPAAAAVQVGASDLPSDSRIPIVVTPDRPDGFAKGADAQSDTDAAPASAIAVLESPTPAVSTRKVRTRSSHVQRRRRNAYSASPRYRYRPYYQNGYARAWWW